MIQTIFAEIFFIFRIVIATPRRYLLIVSLSAFFIFSPSIVKAGQCFAVQEGFKENFCFFMSDKDHICNNCLNMVLPQNYILSQGEYLVNEGSAESSGSLVRLSNSDIFFNSVNGQPVLDKETKEITKKSTKNSPGNYFYELIRRDPLIPFLFGMRAGGLCLGLFSSLTQQHHNRRDRGRASKADSPFFRVRCMNSLAFLAHFSSRIAESST
jgi:hypothetical protein